MSDLLNSWNKVKQSWSKVKESYSESINIRDRQIQALEEFVEYQEELLTLREKQISALRMQIFVEQRKNFVVDKKTIEKLKNAVKENYGTQTKFAEELGISKSQASKWLSGREIIPFERAKQIQDMTDGLIEAKKIIRRRL